MSTQPLGLAVRTDGNVVRVSVHREDNSEVVHVDLTADAAETIGLRVLAAAGYAHIGEAPK